MIVGGEQVFLLVFLKAQLYKGYHSLISRRRF